MSAYFLTNKAVEDLNGIWEYTFEQWSEQQADRYYHLKTHHHIIFYRQLQENRIEITRILHEKMDMKKRITE